MELTEADLREMASQAKMTILQRRRLIDGVSDLQHNKNLDAAQVCQKFKAAGVTDDLIGEIKEHHLISMGIRSCGDRLLIMKSLRQNGLICTKNTNSGSIYATQSQLAKPPPKIKKKMATAVDEDEESVEVEEEEEEEDEDQQKQARPNRMSLEDAQDRIRKLGLCDAGYDWLQVPEDCLKDPSASCQICHNSNYEDGFRCAADPVKGGSHNICWHCVGSIEVQNDE